MKTLSRQSFFAIPCLLLALFLVGCAASRLQTSHPQGPAQTPSRETMNTLADSTVGTVQDLPHHQVYRLLSQAFQDLQAKRQEDALRSLEGASIVLSKLVTTHTDSLLPKHLAGLVRVNLELYRALLPPTAPINPKSALALLLHALPEDIASHIRDHPHYRELYIRTLAGSADVPVDYTPEVIASIRYFQTDRREMFRRWLYRSGTYMPMIREAFGEAGLPQDLAYKAMIESGFNPRAYSRVGAAGIWQFVRYTAPLYGLKRNTWVDERRDPQKATHAAARHIQHLYDLFGDWRLVIAAYNCGQGRLNRAIRKAGTRDFWKLKNLPRETRNHLPRFMAALLISKDPEWFGFSDVVYQPPLAYDTVQVSEWVDLRLAAECAGTSYESMRALNPELRRGYTPAPPVRKVYPLRIPAGSADLFRANYARIPDSRKVQMVDYLVRYGDTVSDIAKRMRISAQAILDANGIRNPRRLRAGKRLRIPIPPQFYARARKPKIETPPDLSRHVRVAYSVRRGDTLWDIARQEGVKPEQIRAWNGLLASQHIFPGNRLVIWKPVEHPVQDAQKEQAAIHGFYTIKPGDTLWNIARAFHTSVSDLKKWNGIRHASRIRAGAKLLVQPADGAHID